jgi:PAS domain S-box-containing protein
MSVSREQLTRYRGGGFGWSFGLIVLTVFGVGASVGVDLYYSREMASFQYTLLCCSCVVAQTLALGIVAFRALSQNRELLRVHLGHRKFQEVVNSIEGMVVWEAHPQTFRFHFVSPQAERLLGLPLKEWLEPGFWLRQLHSEDRDKLISQRHEGIEQKRSLSLEYRLVGLNGREIWVRETSVVVLKNNAPVFLRGVLFDCTEQKLAEQKLSLANQQLLDVSRQAGMAEVATGVLHNVGNVLNSVNVAANLVYDHLRQSKVSNLTKAIFLMRDNAANLKSYLFEHPKGQLVPNYLIDLAVILDKEQEKLLKETSHVIKNLSHIKDVVAMQQGFARVSGVIETLPVSGLVEDALQINAAGFTKDGIEIVREFQTVPPISVDRHKVLQILVNLHSNARQALNASGRADKRIMLGIATNGDNRIKITVRDNGVGIARENLTRIFSHGFTTKPNGHGFGLHSAALAAKEMGGRLMATSDGVGTGASFTLELPIARKET